MSEPNRQYHQALSANRKLLDENARLKAEVERLTEAHSDALADFWAIHKGYFDLKAEVERLRKAGDAMQKRLIFLHDRWDSDEPNIESDAWNAAKEGKQP